MPRIVSQKDFSKHRKLTFCYLCGKPLDGTSPTNDDHCPPKSVFNAIDRSNYPIILKVHKKCNHSWHLSDDMLSRFFDPLSNQGKVNKSKHQKQMEKRKVGIVFQGFEVYGYKDVPLRPFGKRLIQCMHALLYKEWLPTGTICDIMFPFAQANQKGQSVSDEIRDVSLAMSKRIVSSVKAESYDFVTAYKNKFKYVCCWSTFDSGNPICLFAFDIMHMSKMAIPLCVLPKAAIGYYALKPPQAEHSKATKLQLPLTEEDILYPLPF